MIQTTRDTQASSRHLRIPARGRSNHLKSPLTFSNSDIKEWFKPPVTLRRAQGTYVFQLEEDPRRPQRQKCPDCAQRLGWHPVLLHSGTCSWWCLKTCHFTLTFTSTLKWLPSSRLMQLNILENLPFHTKSCNFEEAVNWSVFLAGCHAWMLNFSIMFKWLSAWHNVACSLSCMNV